VNGTEHLETENGIRCIRALILESRTLHAGLAVTQPWEQT